MGMRQTTRTAGRVAQLVLIAGMTAMLASAETSGITTHTELATATQQVSGHSVATYTATVLGEDGAPATGSVVLVEGNRQLASAALDAKGQAHIRYDALGAGYHALTAVYQGDAIHLASHSSISTVQADATTTPSFKLGIAVVNGTDATTMTLAAPGDSGSLVATITPVSGFTGFISLSLSGAATSGNAEGASLPVGVTYTFAPANLQIVAATTANPTGAKTADMELVTSSVNGIGLNGHGPSLKHDATSGAETVFLAVLLPGALAMGYLGRKRKHLLGVFVLMLVGGLATASLTGCAARYRYLNHGPGGDQTPTGTFTLTVTAQTNDGVSASTQSQTMTLVVK
jgi:hypothetical protein